MSDWVSGVVVANSNVLGSFHVPVFAETVLPVRRPDSEVLGVGVRDDLTARAWILPRTTFRVSHLVAGLVDLGRMVVGK